MKIKKGIAFLIVHLTLTCMFSYIAIFAREYLIGVGVPIIAGMITNIVQYTLLQVRDAEIKSKNYVPALDPNNHVQTGETVIGIEQEAGK